MMAARPDPEPFGLSVALAVPFTATGDVDLHKLAEHAAWCLDSGCRSVTVFGTTGEGASLGRGERERVLGALASRGIEPGQIVAAIVATDIRDAAAQLRAVGDFGCRAALLLPPFYYPAPDEEGLYAWFAGALERSAAAVILYHIPAVTGVPISPQLVRRLRAAFPGRIAGVKDSAGDAAGTNRMLAAHADLAILVGDERQLAAAVRQGAEGSISGLANICPGPLRELVATGENHAGVVALVDAVVRHPVTPAVKALIAHRTGDAAWRHARPPLVALGADAASRLGALHDAHFATPPEPPRRAR